MRNRGRVALAFILAAAVLRGASGCNGPTYITLDITTNAVCSDVGSTSITVGTVGDFETKPPVGLTKQCTDHAIGTLTVLPGRSVDEDVGIKIVMGVRRAADSCSAPDYAGCVVARRAVRYVPNQETRASIELDLECLDVPCGALETCSKGSCVSFDGTPVQELDASVDAGPVDASRVVLCDLADPSMLVCLRFEGSIVNEASSGLTPSRTDNATYAAGVHGSALSMSAATVVQFPTDPKWSAPGLTAEAWVKPRTLPTGTARAGIIDSNNRWGLFIYPGGIAGCLGVSSPAGNLVAGQWTHVACTADGSNVRVYINGANVSTAAAGPRGTSTAPLNVGANSPQGDDVLDGLLDDVRVFNVARTPAQIAEDALR